MQSSFNARSTHLHWGGAQPLPSPKPAQRFRSATFALSQTCATLELRRFPHMEAQPFALSQTCATLEMGRRFPQTFATLEKGGAFHREAQPSPLSQTFAPPKPAHRRWERRSGALLHPRRGGRHSGRSAGGVCLCITRSNFGQVPKVSKTRYCGQPKHSRRRIEPSGRQNRPFPTT